MRTHLNILIAVILAVFAFAAVANAQLTNDDVWDALSEENPWIVPNGTIFAGDIQIPPPTPQGEQDLPAGTYTIEFVPGVSVFFQNEVGGAGGSLTITTQEVQGGDAIGRINAHGEEGNMVTLDEAVLDGGWGGILVTTFPDEGNRISYCEVTNVDGVAIEIGTGNIPARCVVERSHIHDIGGWGNGIQIWSPENNGSDFSIRSNVIHDTGWRGIEFDGAFAGQFPELAIVNNVIYDNPSDGIQLHNTFSQIWVANNVVYGNGGSQIQLWNANEDPCVYNNTVDGTGIENTRGVDVDMAPWSAEIRNNIIVNCAVGIRNTAGGNPEVDFQLIFNCVTPLDGCQDANEDIIELDPEFVDDQNGDYHLNGNSPAIDEGDDNLGIDLNFTHNDMGAYGGPNADPEMASRLFGTVIPGQHHFEVGGSVDDGYTYVINNGTVLEFDAEVGLWSTGVLDVNGVQGDSVIFRGFQGAAWGGIGFGGAGAHDSEIQFAKIHGAEWDGISIGDTWVNLIDHCSTHDNGRSGIHIMWNNGPTTITNSNICNNGQYGIYVAIDWADDFPITIGDPGMGNHIHHNGLDGLHAISNSIISEGNHYEENTRYGAYVGFDWGDENSSFTDDLLEWNGVGLSFNNIWVSLDGVHVWNNILRGMECIGGTFVDMGMPQDPRQNSIRRSGWQGREVGPIANVDEIKMTQDADIWIDGGQNDIYDDRFGPGIENPPYIDHIISRLPNLGQIVGATNFFGWVEPGFEQFFFSPMDLVNTINQAADNWVDGIDEERAAGRLLVRAFEYFEEDNYSDGMGVLQDILSDYPETQIAANCPMLMLRCARTLDISPERLLGYFEDLEVPEENMPLTHNRDLASNLLLLEMEEYDDAIENFQAAVDRAECREDSIVAEINLAYAEYVQEIRRNGFRLNAVGSSFDSRLTELLSRLHEAPATRVAQLPISLELTSAFPNPFNSATSINYALPEVAHVKLSVLDLQGREVAVILEGEQTAGRHTATWDASGLSSGVYLGRLQASGNARTVKLTLVR